MSYPSVYKYRDIRFLFLGIILLTLPQRGISFLSTQGSFTSTLDNASHDLLNKYSSRTFIHQKSKSQTFPLLSTNPFNRILDQVATTIPSSFQKNDTSNKNKEKRNEIALKLIQTAKEIGQVGSKASEEDQNKLQSIANELSKYTDDKPARYNLSGIHSLLYSASKGGSSGAIGPFFVGTVTQNFINESMFQNEVTLGPLKISLTAKRQILDDVRIRVLFEQTTVYFLGVQVAQSPAKGSGVWKQLFVGEVLGEDGNRLLLRVLETPSLFIITKVL